jgi:hypothetical protein
VRAICGARAASQRDGAGENVLNAFFRGLGQELAKLGGDGRRGAQTRALAALARKKSAVAEARDAASAPAPCIVAGRAMMRLALRCTHEDPTRRPSVAAARDEMAALLVHAVVYGAAHVTPASAASPRSAGQARGATARAPGAPPPSYSEAVAPAVAPGVAVAVEPAAVEARLFKRPRGRAPRGQVWDTTAGEWRRASDAGAGGGPVGGPVGGGSAASAGVTDAPFACDRRTGARAMPSASAAAEWRRRALTAEIRASALQSEHAALAARCAEAEELSRRLNQRLLQAASGTSLERAVASGEMHVRTAFAKQRRRQSLDRRDGIGCMERAWLARAESAVAQRAALEGSTDASARASERTDRGAAIERALSADDGVAVLSASRSAESSPSRSASPG